MIYDRTTDLIGNTPLVRITGFNIPNDVQILAKLEMLNPGGSIKDRLGMKLIEDAFEKGLIDKDSTIIEPTAGNTGIGLGLAGQVYDLKMIFTVPEQFSIEKQQLMKALGAEIVHTNTKDGMQGAINKAKELNKKIENSYVPLQFENSANPVTYYETLGPEIVKDLEGNIPDVFMAGAGSGGTFSGVSKYLREQSAEVQTIVVEPEGSIIAGGNPDSHETEGIGMEAIPDFMKDEYIDKVYTISDKEAFYYVKDLAKKSGLYVGSSSGSVFAAALKEAEHLEKGSVIVTVFPDSSERYLSKDIYQ